MTQTLQTKVLFRHHQDIFTEFSDKIILLSGARQTGKTWFCEHHAAIDRKLNFDLMEDRKEFKGYQNLPHGPGFKVLFIDEIQKLKGWRNLLKGYYEKFKHTQFIVSGSTAFELLKGDRGDSLAGRVIPIRLEPLTFREFLLSFLTKEQLTPPLNLAKPEQISHLNKPHTVDLLPFFEPYYRFGGFPELLVQQNEKRTGIWIRQYLEALLTRDVKDLVGAKDSDRVEQVLSLLLEGIGSSYSLRSLSKTLLCSPNTIKSDVLILKKLLWGFEVTANQKSLARTLQRPKKFYPVDWIFQPLASTQNPGAIFENLIVCAMHRHLNFENFGRIKPLTMHYFQNYEGQEIDIVISQGKTALLALEIKHKAKGNDFSHLERLCVKLQIPMAIVVTRQPGVFEWINPNLLHLSCELWLGFLH